MPVVSCGVSISSACCLAPDNVCEKDSGLYPTALATSFNVACSNIPDCKSSCIDKSCLGVKLPSFHPALRSSGDNKFCRSVYSVLTSSTRSLTSFSCCDNAMKDS